MRAVDDSGNLGRRDRRRDGQRRLPVLDLGHDADAPPTADSRRPEPVEVGVKFKSDRFGTVTGIRFYKAATNTGTHVGSLWTADRHSGSRRRRSPARRATGWQTVTFATPVAVTPNTTYVASYFAPNGHYSATQEYFYRGPAPGPNGGGTLDSPPLHAIRNTGHDRQRRLRVRLHSTFPTNSYGAANYWVDVRCSPIDAPGTVTGVSAVAGGRTSANVSWTAPSSGGAPTSYKITPYVGSTAQPSTTVSGTPPATSKTVTGLTSGTTYRFTVQAINPTGSGPASAQSNAVTPLNPVVPAKPTNVAATGATQSAKVSWTAPASDGDSAITGYTVTPYIGSTAQASVQAAASRHQHDGDRAHQRHGLHVPRDGGQRRRQQPRIGPVQRRDAGKHDLRLLHACERGLGRPQRGRSGREVHVRPRRVDHRHPLLQGVREHRDPHRQPVERRPGSASPR